MKTQILRKDAMMFFHIGAREWNKLYHIFLYLLGMREVCSRENTSMNVYTYEWAYRCHCVVDRFFFVPPTGSLENAPMSAMHAHCAASSRDKIYLKLNVRLMISNNNVTFVIFFYGLFGRLLASFMLNVVMSVSSF